MTGGQLVHPRSIVTINGGAMDYIRWEVNNNGYYQADTFSVTLPLRPDRVGWWSEMDAFGVSIHDGRVPDPSNFTIQSLVTRTMGQTDSVEIDAVGRTVRLTGRDGTAKLIDAKTLPPDQNLTSSQVVLQFAAKYGLIATAGDSVKSTSTKIGSYYNFDHTKMNSERTPWDILCYLAHQERFVIYVSGNTLFFRPKPEPEQARILTLDDSKTIITGPAPSLTFMRTMTLAHGVVVNVRSWNKKELKGFTETARMKRSKDPVTKKNSPAQGQEQVYSYTIPNLSRDQAQQKARAYLESICQHEVRFEANDMPGDPTLDPFQPVKWNYVGTKLQQVYYLDSVVRSFDYESGYRMNLRGKNHSVESQVII